MFISHIMVHEVCLQFQFKDFAVAPNDIHSSACKVESSRILDSGHVHLSPQRSFIVHLFSSSKSFHFVDFPMLSQYANRFLLLSAQIHSRCYSFGCSYSVRQVSAIFPGPCVPSNAACGQMDIQVSAGSLKLPGKFMRRSRASGLLGHIKPSDTLVSLQRVRGRF